MKKKLFNYQGGTIRVQWNDSAASEPVEMMIYDTIGEDPWDMGGVKAVDVRKALNEAPKDRDLKVRVNSKGGDVHEGFAIRNALSEWPKKVTTVIDGVAASTASWALNPGRPGDEVHAHRASQVFVHDAMSFGFGNADDFRDAADDLDKTSEQIADMYSEKTGRRQSTMRDIMKNDNGKGTLMTGEEAEEMGLVDKIIDGKAVRNFKPGEFAEMQNRITKFYNSIAKGGEKKNQQPTPQDTMKKRMIALLNKHGVKEINGVAISPEMTDEQMNKVNDEQLEAAFNTLMEKKNKELDTAPRNQDIETLRKQVEQLTEVNKESLKNRVTNEVTTFVNDDKLEANLKDRVLKMALAFTNEADREEYLAQFRNRQPNRPGGAPLRSSVECISEAFDDIQNYVLDNGPRFRNEFIGQGSQGRRMTDADRADMASRSLLVANTIAKNKEKIISHWNNNSIDSALQRQVILQDMVEAYAIVLLRLDVFSTMYQNIPLEGTDKVEVPYFPLQTTASTSFVKGTGYTTSSDWTEQKREILVGGDGDSGTSGSSSATGTYKDRLYQMINFDSYDLRRQPYLNLSKLFVQATNKLAVDLFTNVVSKVITAANFGTSISAVAANAFNADSVADLRAAATAANWPLMGRNLVVDHTYYTPMLKDPAFRNALSYGNTDPIQQGRIQNAYGFENIYEVPNLTNYSPATEHLVGWINHKSAVLVATANVAPAPAVRVLCELFEIITDARTGISFAHRRFADATKDRVFEVVESSIGAEKGVDAALNRMTSQ